MNDSVPAPSHYTQCMACGRETGWDTRQQAKQYEGMECYTCGEPEIIYIPER